MAKKNRKPNGTSQKRSGPLPRKPRRAPDELIVPQDSLVYEVDPSEAGMRLDQFLSRKLKWRSRTKVQELIETREILAGSIRRDSSYRVKAGEKIEAPLPPPPEEANRIHEIPLDIIYEDEHLIVLNKQPNIVVHPVGRHRFDTLLNALHLRYRDLEDKKNDVVPKLAHRIDRETSGALVALKTGRHERGVPIVFENTNILKEYLAIAEGVIERDSGEINLPIGQKPGAHPRQGLRAIREDGQASLTQYTVVERFDRFTLVRLRLLTGRQHQIRVHLQAIGHPVLCDERYGLRTELRLSDVRPLKPDEEDTVLIDRQALHSFRIGFPHPVTGKNVLFEAPLAEDMQRTLKVMREASGGD